MDFAWTDEQLDFRKEVIRFAKQELNDDMIENDREEKFCRDCWNKCGSSAFTDCRSRQNTVEAAPIH